MAKLIKYEMDGGSVVVEVDDDLVPAEARVSRAGYVETAQKKFDEALAVVRPVADAVVAQVDSLIKAPDEFAVEFGIKFTAETGAIIAKTGAEGSFKVSIVWKSGGT